MTRKSVPSMSDAMKALAANQALINIIEKKSRGKSEVSGPIIRDFKAHFENSIHQPIDLLNDLTRWLIGARKETESLIRANMEEKWSKRQELERIPSSVANSLRRSAGTNYQLLISYALARFLAATNSAWYVQKPVPKEFAESLSITFTAGIDIEPTEELVDQEQEVLVEQHTTSTNDVGKYSVARVQPDVDILLRNASWKNQPNLAEPVILLSVKTSLVDRGGQAARWKIYFDLATHPCPHKEQFKDCAYDQLGISMENADSYHITHGIVTANIYKYSFHDSKYHTGELASGQTRSNTYMFELKLTTRNDGKARTPSDWRQFPHIKILLDDISKKYSLDT